MKKRYVGAVLCLMLTMLLCTAALLCGCAENDDPHTTDADITEPTENLEGEMPGTLQNKNDNGGFCLGFGQVELPLPDTPDGEPLYIAGFKNAYEATGVLDLQCATAVWLDTGHDDGILFIGVDCVGLSSDYVAKIRERLTENGKLPESASVNVYSTHDHAGVDTLGLWGPVGIDGKNEKFMETVVSGAVKAAELAYGDRRTGTLTYSNADTSSAVPYGEFAGDDRPIQRDSRDPQFYDPLVHQLRFIPDPNESDDADMRRGIRIIIYGAHAESLWADNSLVSRDFPGELARTIYEECGDRVLFMPGAVGGLIMTADLRGDNGEDRVWNMRYTGERLAAHILTIPAENEEILTPDIDAVRVRLTVPLDNTVFMYYKFLGILGNEVVAGDGETGYSLISELGVVRIGDCVLAMIPGEIFPELVYGGYIDGAAAADDVSDPTPLCEIAARAGYDRLLICGLANDELGYIIPPGDFLVDGDAPYLKEARGEDGRGHYEETNSAGKRTAGRIAAAFSEAVSELRPSR